MKGLSEEAGLRIEAAAPFSDEADLARRAALSAQNLRFLARAGALKTLLGHRYQAHWQVSGVRAPMALEDSAAAGYEVAGQQKPKKPDSGIGEADHKATVHLPAPGVADDMFDDYRYLSLTLGPHPMGLLRANPMLAGHKTAVDLEAMRQGQFVKVAGIVTGRQRPGTATGVLFVTLEDETGNINVIVWASTLERYRAAVLQGQLLRIKGVVEREKEVIHVVAGHIEDATGLLNELTRSELDEASFRSRDFK